MVFQVAGAVVLPIILLIMAVSPFEEPVNVQPGEDSPPQNLDSVYFAFFILWVIWILILFRVLYQVKRGTFKIKKGI